MYYHLMDRNGKIVKSFWRFEKAQRYKEIYGGFLPERRRQWIVADPGGQETSGAIGSPPGDLLVPCIILELSAICFTGLGFVVPVGGTVMWGFAALLHFMLPVGAIVVGAINKQVRDCPIRSVVYLVAGWPFWLLFAK